jgi:hypothetical protein
LVLSGLAELPTSPPGAAVTFKVPALSVATPDVLVLRAPATLIVLPASEIVSPIPLATEEAPRATAFAVAVKVTLLAEFEEMAVAVVVTVPFWPTPVAVAPILRLVALMVVVPEFDIPPVVTPTVPAVRVVLPAPERSPVRLII